MMCSPYCRVWQLVAASLFLSTAVVVPARADQIDLRPVADTFVVNPTSPALNANLNGAQNFDFGGAGSRAVASSAAFSQTSGSAGAHGQFRSLLRFDASSLAGDQISGGTLQIYATDNMTGGKQVFNTNAQSGYFDVSLLRLPSGEEWAQGIGSPGVTTVVTSGTQGTTAVLLDGQILPEATITDLGDFYFDATQFGANNQLWYSFPLSSSAFDSQVSQGGLFTLLLSPAAGDQTVNFNFQCYNQNNGGGNYTIWPTGPQLVVAVPEPSTASLLAPLFASLGGVVVWKVRHLFRRSA